MLRACNIMGELGWGEVVEFGPGKHSLGHSYYVYLLDPDGHRVELLPDRLHGRRRPAGSLGHADSQEPRRGLGSAAALVLVLTALALPRLRGPPPARH